MTKQGSHIHTTRRIFRPRTFSGEEESWGIVWWLNNCDDERELNRIKRLMNALAGMTGRSVSEPVAAKGRDRNEKRRHSRVRSSEHPLNYVNRLVGRYRAFPLVIDSETEGWEFLWTPTKSQATGFGDEFNAALAVLELGSRGLSRIGFCGCRKAFFKRFAHQKFCTDKCRVRFYTNDPKWKAYRTDKARYYYWLHQNKNVK
jgi:hypothetical protein